MQLPYVAALGVSWTPSFLPELNVIARVDATFGGTIDSDEDGRSVKNGMIFDAWLMPSYAITPNIKVGIDIAVDIHGLDTLKITGENPVPARTEVSEFIDYGFGPWFELAGGGARARLGVVMMIPGSARYKTNPGNTYMKYSPILTGEPVVSIPISLTYSF